MEVINWLQATAILLLEKETLEPNVYEAGWVQEQM